jgi:formylglycine-generating enzyme required for sulfatase activity
MSWAHGNAAALLSKYAWFADNSHAHLHPVGPLKPNDWGLFDMLGNATEGCEDLWKGDHAEDGSEDLEAMEDIQGYRGHQASSHSPMGGRILRGDSIRFKGSVPSCATRGASPASDCWYTIGF